MSFQTKVALAGSTPAPINSQPGAELDCSESAFVTLVLKRKDVEPSPHHQIEHEDFACFYGADHEDIDLVERFAHEYGLAVIESSAKKRTVRLTGTLQALSTAFDCPVANFVTEEGKTFRAQQGGTHVPAEIADAVVAVLGLDTRAIAKPHFRKRKSVKRSFKEWVDAEPARASEAIVRGFDAPSDAEPPLRIPDGAFLPQQVAKFYNFPAGLTGAGQTIAILELGGGYSAQDLTAYFTEIGIATQPAVTAVSVDGGQNAPGSEADGEVQLDIQVCGAVAPGANIVVYFAPNTEQGFVDGITAAVHDAQRKPSVLSISWGGPEETWTPQAITALNAVLQDAATLGVTVTVASGDDGSTDGWMMDGGKLHVDFPASSPFALACGGTKMTAHGDSIATEAVWNGAQSGDGAGGGGISRHFEVPGYQKTANIPVHPETNQPGRGVPDIAGNADPASGYFIRVNGEDQVIGGTSAVAPLIAALMALLNEKAKRPAGFIHTALYAAASTCRDIGEGNNDDSGLGHFSAGRGWDACTGLGVVDGTKLLKLLSE